MLTRGQSLAAQILRLLPILVFSWSVHAEERPHLMAVLGDSISAAAFSTHPLVKQDPSFVSPVYDPVPLPPLTTQLMKIAFLFESKGHLSWASGLDINSFFIRLRDHFREKDGSELEVVNLAQSGSTSVAAPGQAEKLLKILAGEKYASVKAITLLSGTNDLCRLVDHTPEGRRGYVDRIIVDLTKTLSILSKIRQTERVRVLLIGLPRAPDLNRAEINDTHTVLGMRCQKLRDEVLKLCNGVTVFSTEKEYDARVDTIRTINGELAELARAARDAYPNLDVRFVDAFEGIRFEVKDLAFDCFHPSRSGHMKIADRVWETQPWFRR